MSDGSESKRSSDETDALRLQYPALAAACDARGVTLSADSFGAPAAMAVLDEIADRTRRLEERVFGGHAELNDLDAPAEDD